ncbi:MAG TPA: 50S ribosomal protein L11 methyltransferase [Candidatus Omnitrophota bacterium]|nr:50S ribosomal protein L11 methyltransferase [Candidatus Omnitrophota bacterium]
MLFELVITTKKPSAAAAALIKNVLIRQGIPVQNIVEVEERPFCHLSIYFQSSRMAGRMIEKIHVLGLRHVSLKIKELKKDDWFSRWKTDFKSFLLTRRIRVIPAWEKEKHQQGRSLHDILIDPQGAFGSGLHPTTRFMAEIIERSKGKFKSFLDLGTGSGILSLVAYACGAEETRAIDNSAEAVRSAKKNLRENRFPASGVLKAGVEDFPSRKKFDFVAANLITFDLIKLKRKLVRLVKPRFFLAVSGISENNLPRLKREFSALPLRCLQIKQGEGWCALLYQKLRSV